MVSAALYLGPHAYEQGDKILNPPPGIPAHVKDDLAQGCYDDAGNYITEDACFATSRPELEGPGVGASNSFTYGRPDTWMQRAGLKFEWAPTNIWSQRGYHDPVAIVVHVTGGGTCDGIKNYFKNNDRRVSSHFTVCDGKVIQQVETGDGAHHAGIWGARWDTTNPMIQGWRLAGINPNSVTIGIENVIACNGDHIDNFPEMRRGLVELIAWAGLEHNILIDRNHVIAHSQLDGVNRAVDPHCGIDLDKIVQEAADIAYSRGEPPLIEWGETDPNTGNRWNLVREVWVAPNGDTWDPDDGFYSTGQAIWKRNGIQEWGEIAPEGHVWNNWIERWVSADGRYHYNPNLPHLGWYCVWDCPKPQQPQPTPTPKITPPNVGGGGGEPGLEVIIGAPTMIAIIGAIALWIRNQSNTPPSTTAA